MVWAIIFHRKCVGFPTSQQQTPNWDATQRFDTGEKYAIRHKLVDGTSFLSKAIHDDNLLIFYIQEFRKKHEKNLSLSKTVVSYCVQ